MIDLIGDHSQCWRCWNFHNSFIPWLHSCLVAWSCHPHPSEALGNGNSCNGGTRRARRSGCWVSESDIRYESIWHDCSVWSIGIYWGSTDPESNSPQLLITFAFSAQWTVTMDPGWSPNPLQPVPQHSHFAGTAPFGTAGADLHDLQVINYARCFACYLIKSDKQQIFWHFRCLQVHPTLPMELWSDASFCSDTSSFDQIDQIQVSFPGHRDGWCGLGPRFTKSDIQKYRDCMERHTRAIPRVCIWLYYDIMIRNLYNLAHPELEWNRS